MLNEFDQWMETNYLSKKVRKDRWAWNFGILKRRPITVREGRQWKPAVAYCRYADCPHCLRKNVTGVGSLPHLRCYRRPSV